MGWFSHPLFSNGLPNFGKFDEILYKPPVQASTPVDFTKIKYKKETL